MPVLHNRINRDILKAKLKEELEPRINFSFYKYFHIADSQLFRDALFKELYTLNVLGRIYIAHEGINGQVSVSESKVKNLRSALYNISSEMQGMRLNEAVQNNNNSFYVLKIKVRPKIVADGIDDPLFDSSKTGKHLNAAEFNALSSLPQTLVVDMRNHYEYEVGHFENALEIPSDTFREQLPMAAKLLEDNKEKNIIMYCTGGIRCEKASAYLLHNGFTNVFQLDGGIIEYTRQVTKENIEQKFIGKNFVFDDRLGERITPDIIAHCHQCGKPADAHTNCRNEGCHALFIQCEECSLKYEGCCSQACYSEIHLPEELQKERRKNQLGKKIFNKSRLRKGVGF